MDAPRLGTIVLALALAAAPAARAAPPVAAEKQTTLGLYLTSKEAYAKWGAAPKTVKVIDVRTPEEYLYVGHPAMAWNVPFMMQGYEWDAQKKQFRMQPTVDFVERMKSIAKPGDTLFVMCRSGGRAAAAIDALAKAGYRDVYNIVDGMEGDTVKDAESVFKGQRMINGWKNAGLPWTYEVDPTLMLLPKGR
jgi:rhodanese-related sulfurtransferase